MPRLTSLLRTLAMGVALVALFAAARTVAHADPIRLTSGTVYGCSVCFDRVISVHNVTGGGLVLNGGGESYTTNTNGGTASVTFFPFAGPIPSLAYQGNTYFVNALDSVFNFTLVPFNFPAPMPVGTDIFIDVPFTMTGVLAASTTSPFGPVVFSFDVAGEGIARLRYRYVAGGFQTPMLQDVVYTFQPSAVPEPATMILLATGLAGVAAKARRRRKS